MLLLPDVASLHCSRVERQTSVGFASTSPSERRSWESAQEQLASQDTGGTNFNWLTLFTFLDCVGVLTRVDDRPASLRRWDEIMIIGFLNSYTPLL